MARHDVVAALGFASGLLLASSVSAGYLGMYPLAAVLALFTAACAGGCLGAIAVLI